MNIDERDIEKGILHNILPVFHPGSITYLRELNSYRMYAEVWSNRRSKDGEERRAIGHIGYLETLECGERLKKRKSDKIRFNYFVVADSINYKGVRDVYGKLKFLIQMGGVQTNNIINANSSFSEDQSLLSNSELRSEGYLQETFKLDLENLELHEEGKSNKHYFEISTNVDNVLNQNQKMILYKILGGVDIYGKLRLLYKAGRKRIRCLFENPENITNNIGTTNPTSRLCVAWPFNETLVFDFAGRLEEYSEVCLLGTLIKTTEGLVESESYSDVSQIDCIA